MAWESIYIIAFALLVISAIFVLFKIYQPRQKTSSFAHYQQLIDCLTKPTYIMQDKVIVSANKLFLDSQYHPNPIINQNVWTVWGDSILASINYEDVLSDIRSKNEFVLDVEFNVDDDTVLQLHVRASDLDLQHGLILVQFEDQTEVIQARQDLLDNQVILDSAQEIAHFGYWHALPDARQTVWSKGMNDIFGIDTPELQELYKTKSRWSLFHEADREELQASLKMAFETGESKTNWTLRAIRPDGELRHLINRVGIIKDKNGAITRVVGMIQDVTNSIWNEDQLRHAQKMEAVGELTGGLSHDFNNLLHVILGNVELIPTPVDKEDIESLNAIRRAAERGSELTQRLLAFSRKQYLDPQSLNVNDCLSNMLPLIERTLGEYITIAANTAINLLNCKVDIGQLESTILNLAINAKHAMPNGGSLSISTENTVLDSSHGTEDDKVKAGQYVKITIKDTGEGMSPQILKRVFEPFFTTREVGEGSGLGLSMVYGFIRQSEGHITLSSKVGEGTVISLYLPVSAPQLSIVENLKRQDDAQLDGKVLLIEDDADVSTLTRKFLESVGLRVIFGCNAEDARNAIAEHKDFSLLLCDMVLPGGNNGTEVAKIVTDELPNINVLFMSGYSHKEIGQMGVSSNDINLLQKPFRKVDMIKKLQQIIAK